MFNKGDKAKAATVLYHSASVICPHCRLHVIDWENLNGWKQEKDGKQVVPFIWHSYRVLECPSCKKPISVRGESRMRCPR